MSQIHQVKEAVDIVDVIASRLDLKQSGSSFKALCPFHSEKSPSFFVNPQLQRYRCFGCGAKGDVFEFLQEYEGMSFYEALQYLADQAGIKLEQFSKTKEDDLREQLLEILKISANYFHFLLTDHKAGVIARDYLKNRGIHSNSIKLFQLGYALSAWDGLLNYLTKKKGFSGDLIEKSGLVVRNSSGRYYDRFRDRVVFPLKNHRGQIVGFSGRILAQEADEQHKQPKYINTPETILYHKAQTLFGYSENYQDIRKKNEVIVCEGEFDVISSQQAHIKHIVAIKGSALTPEQAKLLERSVEKVIITLDSDEAGIKATKRAIEIVQNTNLDLRVINLSAIHSQTKYQDVDQFAQNDPALWKKISKSSTSAYEFLIEVAFGKFDHNSALGRRKIVDELAPIINNISHEVEKEFYLKTVADKLNVTVGTLLKDVQKFGMKKTVQTSKTKQGQDEVTVDPLEQIQEYLLFLLFNAPEDEMITLAKQLRELDLSFPQAKTILDRLIAFDDNFSVTAFASSLPEDLKSFLMEWSHHPNYLSEFEVLSWKKEWKKAIIMLQRYQITQQIEELNRQISEIESGSDKKEEDQRVQKYLLQIAKLQAKLKQASIVDF